MVPVDLVPVGRQRSEKQRKSKHLPSAQAELDEHSTTGLGDAPTSGPAPWAHKPGFGWGTGVIFLSDQVLQSHPSSTPMALLDAHLSHQKRPKAENPLLL